MRNLKKVLSLSLALVMLLGLMVVGAGAATTFDELTDKDEISENYAEAVDLLTAIGVLEGNENSEFMPTGTLTREAAAKIVATLALGVDAAERLSVTSAPFKDVAANRWSAGYIAYCANTGIIDGDGQGSFYPTQEVTGYQFAKMLLGVLGYGANDEYVGTNWALNVATDGVTVGLFSRLGNVGNTAATREEAAQLAFNALNTNMVTYSELFGTYSQYASGTALGGDATLLGTKADKIFNVDSRDVDDDYGVTYHYWYNIGRSATPITDNYLSDTILGTVTSGTKGAMYRAYDWDDVVTVIENGVEVGTIASASLRNGTDPAAAYAGQTLSLIDSPDDNAGVDKIVIVTEYLAKVTRVTAATASADRTVTVTAYTPAGDVTATITTEDYAVGDYILVDPAITVSSGTNRSVTTPVNYNGLLTDGTVAAATATQRATAFGPNVLGTRAAESVSGASVTAYYVNDAGKANGSVTTGGARYTYNGVFAYAGALGYDYTNTGAGDSVVYTLNSGTYNFYLDSNNNVIGVEPVETVIRDYAYIVAVGTDGFVPANRVQVILSDGTVATYTVATANNIAPGQASYPLTSTSADAGKIFPYTIDANNNIVLSGTGTNSIGTWASNYVTFTQNYTTLVYGAGRSNVAYVTDDTVFVYYNPATGSVTRYVGMANAPTIGSGTAVTQYTIVTSTRTGSVNNYVDFIVLSGTASNVYSDNLYIYSGTIGTGWNATRTNTVYYYRAILNGADVVLAADRNNYAIGMHSYSVNADAFTGDSANNVISGLYALSTAGTNVTGTIVEYQSGVAVVRPTGATNNSTDVQIAIPDTADVTDVSVNPVLTDDTVTVGDVVAVAYSTVGGNNALGVASDIYITSATTVVDNTTIAAALAGATSGTFTITGDLTTAVTVPAGVTLYVTGDVSAAVTVNGTLNVGGNATGTITAGTVGARVTVGGSTLTGLTVYAAVGTAPTEAGNDGTARTAGTAAADTTYVSTLTYTDTNGATANGWVAQA